jgi:hypothetical protein
MPIRVFLDSGVRESALAFYQVYQLGRIWPAEPSKCQERAFLGQER